MSEKKNPIIEEVKADLGRDYQRVLTWYHIMHPEVKKMYPEHYTEMRNQWRLCNAVADMIEIDEESSLSTCTVESQYLDRTYAFFIRLFNGSNESVDDETKRSYIADCMEQFKRQTQTETLHKQNITILKMSYDDITFDSNGKAYFDSRNASVFVGSNIQRSSKSDSMRWIATSEDGISRILKKYGLNQVIIHLGNQGRTPEEMEEILCSKENIFLHGITDIANGKHYLCSAPSASSTRHADFPFVEANSPMDIYKIWCEITGFESIEKLVEGIGHLRDDGKFVVNMAKLKARIAMRGANSFDTYEKVENTMVLHRLKHPKVDYCRDSKGTTSCPYKGITTPGVLEMKNPDGSITVQRV